MNIVFININHITYNHIEACVMKRRTLYIKAQKHHRSFFIKKLTAFNELLISMVKLFFLKG